MVERLAGTHPSRSRAVVHGGILSTVAVSLLNEPSAYDQTASALARLDDTLRQIGSDKSKLLTAVIFISDILLKPEMNRAWDEWVDLRNPPVRACIGATLEGPTLVEIMVTVAV